MPNAAGFPDIVPYAEWIKGTALTGKPRSADMKKLDEAVLWYEKCGNRVMLERLREALANWQRSKGAGDLWKKSERNHSRMITLLDAQLRGTTDSDALLGVADFMAPAMINARLGVLYLFGNLSIDETLFSVGLEGSLDIAVAGMSHVAATERIKDENSTAADAWEQRAARLDLAKGSIVSAGQILRGGEVLRGASKPPTQSKLRAAWDWLREKLNEVAAKVMALIRERLSSAKDALAAQFSLEALPGHIRKVCDYLAEKFLEKAAPFISAGLDIARVLGTTIDAGLTKFREWMAARDVSVLAGHPGTICEAIRRAMSMSVGQGLFDTLKGGLKLGTEFMTAGAGALATLLAAVLETLVKMIWRMVEIARMNTFFRQAGEHWRTRGVGGLHEQPIRFNAWFRGYAMSSPSLAILALNTGICGDKMHFLQMFRADGAAISQSTFSAGVTYVDSLKVWGARYLRDVGYTFTSGDQMVNALLENALAVNGPLPGAGRKAWQVALGFLSGEGLNVEPRGRVLAEFSRDDLRRARVALPTP